MKLKELYEKFLTYKLEFSKFVELWPKQLAGESGTHSICVCTKHQNMKLIIQWDKLKSITQSDDTEVKDYESCLKKFMSDKPNTARHLNINQKCCSVEYWQQELSRLLEDEMIDQITYKAMGMYLQMQFWNILWNHRSVSGIIVWTVVGVKKPFFYGQKIILAPYLFDGKHLKKNGSTTQF